MPCFTCRLSMRITNIWPQRSLSSKKWKISIIITITPIRTWKMIRLVSEVESACTAIYRTIRQACTIV